MNDITKIEKKLPKNIKKKNASLISKGIVKFCENYAKTNDLEYLINEIINTKVDEIVFILKKNSYVCDEITEGNLDPSILCEYRPEELDPEKYKSILDKKKMEEYRKKNKATSDAFTCPKCKSKKSEVTQKQIRSGDEPATIFIKCVECGYSYSI